MYFINESYINYLLTDENLKDESLQKDILIKASEAKGISLRESAALLNITSPDYLRNYSIVQKKLKKKYTATGWFFLPLCMLQIYVLIIVFIVHSEKITRN